MATLAEQEARATRRYLFRPCTTPEELKDYLFHFFGLELPDEVVDPESNSTPFGLVWEVYSLALSGGAEDRSRVLAYAARASMKTLDAAILEVLVVLHAKRGVVHLAAQEDQSEKAQEYVRGFLDAPVIRDFVVGDRKRTLELLRYEDTVDPLNVLTKEEYLTDPDQGRYKKVHLKIEVAICSLKGANSKHATFMVVDEVDVVSNPMAYQEAKSIPKGRDGVLPITLLISTRKSSYGLVQEELDRAHETGLIVRHWNLLDVTERCPDRRHRPDLPLLPVYVDRASLTVLREPEYEGLLPTKRAPFEKMEAFGGCLTNCRLFASCRGHLARQTSRARMLSQVADTALTIRDAGNVDYVNAQYLCVKPQSEGLVYPRLDVDLHSVDGASFLERYTGERTELPDLDQLVRTMVDRFGAHLGLGIDFGHTHPFAAVLGLLLPNLCLILRAVEAPSLEEQEQIALCEEKFKKWEPEVWADPAMPGAVKAFRKAGFRMRTWSKGPGSVLDGIRIVQSKLRPVSGDPELLFLRGGDGVAGLVARLQKYHRARDAAGRLLDDPEKRDDDGCDATRYLVMNAYPNRTGRLQLAAPGPAPVPDSPDPRAQELAERARRYQEQILDFVGVVPTRIIGKGRLRLVT